MHKPTVSRTTGYLVLALACSGGAGAQPDIPSDPAELFRRACAACHGAGGAGLAPDHPNYRSFEIKPAALTDPLFNSREPAADWFLVTKFGGKRLGLSGQMPGYGDALTDEQIEKVVGHMKTLADTGRYPPGDLNLTRPIATTKAFPEDEALIINRYEARDGDDVLLTTLYYARRFGPRGHGEIKLTHENKGSESFWEELEIEYKHAFAYSLEREILHAVGIEVAIPLEDDDAPEVLIPYYSVAKVLSPAATFQGQVRAKLPRNGFGDGSGEVRGIVHWLPSEWPRSVTPGLELTLSEPFSGDGDTVATLIPQVYAGLTRGGHVALAAGVELPLTDEAWDYRVRTFLLWDIADGVFWRGW